ncbi:hypothetical protein [Peribacillus alkalitolerans]|uniref:hypothetical protein n=1 Tax=Peribacillus alkalitolerans TaxID=1550385 RepID=UPI0013D06BCE|nr:hypothetical protein [Peribacillus alkalitolerans]
MKKFWLLLSALTLSLALAACAEKKEETTEKETTKEEAPKEEVNLKSVLYKFYADIPAKINAKDADLNAYVNSEETPTPEMKTKASEAAAAVAAELQAITVPAELEAQKADLEAGIKEIADSYTAKAEELKKDAPVLDAAEATFQSGVDKIGAAFESIGMLKPDLGKEVN